MKIEEIEKRVLNVEEKVGRHEATFAKHETTLTKLEAEAERARNMGDAVLLMKGSMETEFKEVRRRLDRIKPESVLVMLSAAVVVIGFVLQMAGVFSG